MEFIGNIIDGIAWIINTALSFYFYIVVASAILSFVNPDPYNPIVKFLRGVTEPAYVIVRRYLPFVYIGGFDLSPIIVIFAIQFCKFAVVRNLDLLAKKLIGG